MAPMASLAAKARLPTSGPGSEAERPSPLSAGSPAPRRVPPRGTRRPGFTLIELLVVMVMMALVSSMIGLALRQGDGDRLEREAARLIALLEAGRSEARASGIAVRFELRDPTASAGTGTSGDNAFRFVGVTAGTMPPGRWLDPDVRARIDGARALRLGPEPLIGAQRIVLQLGERELTLATDGLAPFSVQPSGGTAGDPQAAAPANPR